MGRRTAERLRDSLADDVPADGFMGRRGAGAALAAAGQCAGRRRRCPRAEAVAAIETSARECEVRGETDRAALLREASTTLRAVMRPDALRRAEPDIAALMEAEGIAMRPGPRPVIAAGVLPTLRRAILGMQPVVVRYAGPDAEEPATRILCPYGILYGGRGWLVAHVDGLPEMRLWRLDRIVSVDLLDRGFKRREDFDLAAYAAQSFGVFQEEPIDVVLRFDTGGGRRCGGVAVSSVAERRARAGWCADCALPRRRRAGDVLAPVHVGNGGNSRSTRGFASAACRTRVSISDPSHGTVR